MTYSVRPIRLGTLTLEASTVTYMMNFGKKIQAPCVSWVVEGPWGQAIVDSGPPDADWSTQYHRPMTQTLAERPENAFRQAGVDLNRIRWVILSHLHWDHAYNNRLFPNADFFVQESELEYAQAPLPVHVRGYEVGLSDEPFYRADALQPVRGSLELSPGLRLLHTPGHSPGSQVVLVGEHQRLVIAQDTVPSYANWQTPHDPMFIPNTIHVDLRDYYQSFKLVASLDAAVLPGHDEDVFAHERYIAN